MFGRKIVIAVMTTNTGIIVNKSDIIVWPTPSSVPFTAAKRHSAVTIATVIIMPNRVCPIESELFIQAAVVPLTPA